MGNGLTLGEARGGLFQGLLLTSERLHAASSGYTPFQYTYTLQQQNLAAQAAVWLTRLGAGTHAQELQVLAQSSDLHPAIAERLRGFSFASDPQRLRPTIDLFSGRTLHLGPDLEVSFSRRPRLNPDAAAEPLPMYLLPSGRLLVPAWPDEAIDVSVKSSAAPWGLQIYFNDINALSGEHAKGHEPLQESFYPDHSVVHPGTPLRVEGWRDRSVLEDPKNPGRYAANRFVPTMLEDALAGVFRLRLFGLEPESLIRASENEIGDLIGRLVTDQRTLDLDAVSKDDASLSRTLQPSSKAIGKGPQAVEKELREILLKGGSLVEMLRQHDPRTIPSLQGAGRIWETEPGKDPYFDLGWNTAFGMTVFVVHPSTFFEWTGIRHEPHRYWPEQKMKPVWMDDTYSFLDRCLELLSPRPFHQMGGAALQAMAEGALMVHGYGYGARLDVGACSTGFAAMTAMTSDPSFIRALTGPSAPPIARRMGFVAGVGSLSADAGGQGFNGHTPQDAGTDDDPDKK